MGNLNCVPSRSSSTSISTEDIRVNNKSTGKTSDRREVVSRNVVNNFVQPSYEDLSSNSDMASNSQTLESRDSVNSTNTIAQENILNPSLHSKLIAKLPDNLNFYPEKFTDNKDRNPLKYLKHNKKQLIKAFNAAISKNQEIITGHIGIKSKYPETEDFPELEGKPVLTFKGEIIKYSRNIIYDSIKDEVECKTSSRTYKTTQHVDLSDVLDQSKNLADFITNMRLAVALAIVIGEINALANDFTVEAISPFSQQHKETPLEKLFTPDMESVLPAEIIRPAQAKLHKRFEGRDVPGGLGRYSASVEDPIKIHYM